MEASTTKVSSKGQIVIPANVRKAASLKKGEKILAIAIAIDDTVVLKKIVDKSFEETLKPVWKRVRQMGSFRYQEKRLVIIRVLDSILHLYVGNQSFFLDWKNVASVSRLQIPPVHHSLGLDLHLTKIMIS